MKKNATRWRVILAVLLVVYNVIVFAVPFPKNAAFFVSWLFTLAAIGAQVYVVRAAFYQGEGVKSKFYGWPIAKIGAVYLAVQLVLGLAFMALGFAVYRCGFRWCCMRCSLACRRRGLSPPMPPGRRWSDRT